MGVNDVRLVLSDKPAKPTKLPEENNRRLAGAKEEAFRCNSCPFETINLPLGKDEARSLRFTGNDKEHAQASGLFHSVHVRIIRYNCYEHWTVNGGNG